MVPSWGWFGLSHSIAASDFLDAAQSSEEKHSKREPDGSCVTMSNLILEVTRRHFCCILLEASHQGQLIQSPLDRRMSEN